MAAPEDHQQQQHQHQHRHRSITKPPLHNFSLPCLKWGNQRLLRCVKLTPDNNLNNNCYYYNNNNNNNDTTDQSFKPPPPITNNLDDGGGDHNTTIPTITNKILKHPIHQNQIPTSSSSTSTLIRFNGDIGANDSNSRLFNGKVSPFLQQEEEIINKGGTGNTAAAAIIPNNTNTNNDDSNSPSRPWNLRTRRAACKAPLPPLKNTLVDHKRNNNNNNNNCIDSPSRRILEIDSPSPRRNNVNVHNNNNNNNTCSIVKKEKQVKFSIPLLKEEIEQDFFEIARIRPPRRPKKRPRILQKYLDTIFPGLWLSEVTPDSYKVPDVPE